MKKLIPPLLAIMLMYGCGQDASVDTDSLSATQEKINYQVDSSRAADSLSSEKMKLEMLKQQYHSVRWKLPKGFKFDSLYINGIIQIDPKIDDINSDVLFNSDSLEFRARITGPKLSKCNLELWLDKSPVLLPKKALNLTTSSNGTVSITFKFR